ncbi:OsmC family peroxiredoxin [Saccharolobus solfataricus]|uniref:OsmC family peroxiredoxin n=3 Tax=Saccharolobus solfataricus TaxID=2287 RepID=Q97Z73_SACS2|nr:OsmC family protein [Saccharolobus solfataricus]AAK41320.1 Conserved hypothetical protein [Saccharolobus solfataricus P2]AKA74265.1 OsmC family peroxiredoxin [Saccharolobus solfataricus]AKA76962.1 OsmC family peroxiredoxin [Saccharolobus solfataricus]AKA79654.1 OsmC family peroxiredoxin [Saccharolobus solfataricus]AZF68747.1 OsmC family peroxiredoxin [Saccharolobus solfataricus]
MTVITFTAEGRLDGDKVIVDLNGTEIKVGLLGSDNPTPEEFCLASAISCLILTVYYIAREKGVTINSIEGYIEGKMDTKGFQGVEEVPPGLLEVSYELIVYSKDSRISDILKEAEERCPMRDTLTRSVKVNINWKIKS